MKVAEIVGAKSELWTRFLPTAISDWSHADQSEYEPPSNIREIVETWLETSKETILRLLPAKLKCTTRGEDLSALRTSLETSIAPSSRDATQARFGFLECQQETSFYLTLSRYEMKLKMAKKGCDRDRSRNQICTQTSKWPK